MKRLLFISFALIVTLGIILFYTCGEDLIPPVPIPPTQPTPSPTVTVYNPLGPIVKVENLLGEDHVYRSFDSIVGNVRDPDDEVMSLEIQIWSGETIIADFAPVDNFTSGQQESDWFYNTLDLTDDSSFPGGPDNPVKIVIRATDNNEPENGGPITNSFYSKIYIDDPPEITVTNVNEGDTLPKLTPLNQVAWIEGVINDDFNSGSLKYSFDSSEGDSLSADITDIVQQYVLQEDGTPANGDEITDIIEDPPASGIYRAVFDTGVDLTTVKKQYTIDISGTTNFNGQFTITSVDQVDNEVYFKSTASLGDESGAFAWSISKGVYRVQLSGDPDLSGVQEGWSMIITGTTNFNGVRTVVGADDGSNTVDVYATPYTADETGITGKGILSVYTYFIKSALSWKIPIAYYDSKFGNGEHTLYMQAIDSKGQESELTTLTFFVDREGARYRLRQGNNSEAFYLSDEDPQAGTENNCKVIVDTTLFSTILAILGSPVGTIPTSMCDPSTGTITPNADGEVYIEVGEYSVDIMGEVPITIGYTGYVAPSGGVDYPEPDPSPDPDDEVYIRVLNWDDPDNGIVMANTEIAANIEGFGNLNLGLPISHGQLFVEGHPVILGIEDMLTLELELADIVEADTPAPVDDNNFHTSKSPFVLGMDGIHIEGKTSVDELLGLPFTVEARAIIDLGIDLESLLLGGLTGGESLDLDNLMSELDIGVLLFEHDTPSNPYQEISLDLASLGMGDDIPPAVATIRLDAEVAPGNYNTHSLVIMLSSDTSGGDDGSHPSLPENYGYDGYPDGKMDLYLRLPLYDDGSNRAVGLAISDFWLAMEDMDLGSVPLIGDLGIHDIYLKTKPGEKLESIGETDALELRGFVDLETMAFGFPKFWNGDADPADTQRLEINNIEGNADILIDPPIVIDMLWGLIHIEVGATSGTVDTTDLIVTFGYAYFDGGPPLDQEVRNPITNEIFQGYYAEMSLNIGNVEAEVPILGTYSLAVDPISFIIPITSVGGSGGLY